jgi:ferredoxin-NADP reductase
MATRGASSDLMGTDEAVRRPAIRWQTAVIRRIVQQTARVKSFFVELSQPFTFVAGQHVDVRLTAPDGYQAQRSYSIASAPEAGGALELTIERLDDGEVSPFFHDVAAEGDEIELRGPIGGHFIWRVEDGGPLLLAGGGSGIVPLMSMVRHRSARESRVPLLLLFSSRTWDDLIYRDELVALAKRRDGFELALALTRDTARRAGDYARRVDHEMAAQVLARLRSAPLQAYVCGSNPFVEAAAQSLISAGVPSGLIRIERYGG